MDRREFIGGAVAAGVAAAAGTLKAADGKRNGMPLFEWGKYESREGREVMPFSVHVHHSFVDAVHVAKVVKRLQDYLDSLR